MNFISDYPIEDGIWSELNYPDWPSMIFISYINLVVQNFKSSQSFVIQVFVCTINKFGWEIKKIQTLNPTLYFKNSNNYTITLDIITKRDFPKTLNKLHQKQMNNQHSTYKNRKHTFWHLRTSCLQTGRSGIPQIINNLYSVPRIIVLKLQKDRTTRTKVIAWKTKVSTKEWWQTP